MLAIAIASMLGFFLAGVNVALVDMSQWGYSHVVADARQELREELASCRLCKSIQTWALTACKANGVSMPFPLSAVSEIAYLTIHD